MGALTNSFASPGAAANASLQWGAQGVGLGALGDVLSGLGRMQMGNYAAAVAQNNARIAQANAGAAINAGTYEEEVSKLKTGELKGAQLAAQGANGIDVGVGSAPAVRQTTGEIGAMDAAMIHYNAARQAYGYETEASSQLAQSKLDKLAAVNALSEGITQGASSVLGGATSLAGKAAAYKLSFAAPGP